MIERQPSIHRAISLTTARGHTIQIRHLQAQDAQRLADLYHHLSSESRRLRFLSAPDLPDDVIQSRARRLAQIDARNEAALIATLLADGREQAIGVARLHQDTHDTSSAEAAIVVRDDYQEQAIGTILFDLLLQVAMVRGLRQLWLLCLMENTGMRRLVQNCGLPYTTEISRGEMTIVVELVGDAAAELAAAA